MLRTPLILLATASLALGCGEDGGTPIDGEVCETFVAEHCGETYCGLPEVSVGTGADEFIPLDDGDEIDIVFGSQGGYHIDVGAQMERLCPIVYVRASIWFDAVERHMEAVRTEVEGSSQNVWGVRAFIPCEHWPDTQLTCPGGAGSEGHLEDYEIVVKVEAEDHNGRIASDEQRVQPVCCEG